jgi:hypothetical protein
VCEDGLIHTQIYNSTTHTGKTERVKVTIILYFSSPQSVFRFKQDTCTADDYLLAAIHCRTLSSLRVSLNVRTLSFTSMKILSRWGGVEAVFQMSVLPASDGCIVCMTSWNIVTPRDVWLRRLIDPGQAMSGGHIRHIRRATYKGSVPYFATVWGGEGVYRIILLH